MVRNRTKSIAGRFAEYCADIRAETCADVFAENGSAAEMSCRNRAEFATDRLGRKNGTDAETFAETVQVLVQMPVRNLMQITVQIGLQNAVK